MRPSDTIDVLAGLDPTTSWALRGHRPVVATTAQAAEDTLFTVPSGDEASGLTIGLRLLIAARAAAVDGNAPSMALYRQSLAASELRDSPLTAWLHADALDELIADGADSAAGLLASRQLRTALRHTELLILRPASATEDDLVALSAAGWSVPEIVVLTQVVSFVSYQGRVAQGLAVLAGVTR